MIGKSTRIHMLGHATVFIETPGHKRVLVDPFVQSNPRCPARWQAADALDDLDLVLLTHLHGDHVADIGHVIARNADVPVVAIADAEPWLARKGVRDIRSMNRGGTQEVAGLSVSMTAAVHSSSTVQDGGIVEYGGEPAGYVVRMENAFTIYIAGDTDVFSDMTLIRDFLAPDLAILPVGDQFTMGPDKAAYAAGLLGVRWVIPYHYGTWPMLTGTPRACQAALERRGINAICIELAPGESVD